MAKARLVARVVVDAGAARRAAGAGWVLVVAMVGVVTPQDSSVAIWAYSLAGAEQDEAAKQYLLRASRRRRGKLFASSST